MTLWTNRHTGVRKFLLPSLAMAQPTVRQVYALAAALCERMGEEFPATREAASETIERLRIENGHPAPRLEQTPPRFHRKRRQRQ